MGEYKDLSEFDKIVASRRLGQSVSKTAALVRCFWSAVVRIYQKCSKKGTVVNQRQGRGWSWLIDAREKGRLSIMAALLCLSLSSLLALATAGGVKNCHPKCRCEVESYGLFDSFSLTKVDCSGLGPETNPIPIPLETSHLDLSHNSISSVTDSMLSGPGYTTLVSLDLSSNLISQVSSKAFNKLRYLETLDLSQNILENLCDGCFSGLPLTEVDLSDNKFAEFDLNVFSTRGQETPISVDLSNNLLSTVSRNPHLHVPYIKSLMLAGNQLRKVPRLAGIPLQYLSLDGNPILGIDEGAFEELTDLVYLSLSGLPELSVIHPNSFRGLKNLQVLDLSNNFQLKTLSPDVFNGLSALQELNLSKSVVTPLPVTIFNHMPSIKSATLGPNMHCWKTHKQGQFHRQIGQAKANDILTCDVPGIILYAT
ncbi:tsukushin isoform 2 precursor [Silurus asotus]|uniref:Tsukushin isoform 2 n=1 Tax=Silurus asotus TaxID=30991 RepID=A0AAD5AZY4_SILAS|nr:tsukushin isoform 2 precursor [Silurus asotus]